MKIDSIFSTFDEKFNCVVPQLEIGVDLQGRNMHLVRHAYKSYSRLLVDVHFSEDPVFIWGLVSSFYTCCKNCPILEIQDSFNIYYDYFILRDRKDWNYSAFKELIFSTSGSIRLETRKLTWPFLTNVVKMVFSGNSFALANLATLCKFLSKISLDLPYLESNCITRYLSNEEKMINYNPSPILVNGLNTIIKRWLKDYNPTFLPVRHGSGSVADARPTKLDKYLHLATDRKLDLGIQWLRGYSPQSYYPYGSRGTLVRTSKYITVPKSLTKRRGISMEPATLQYFQQGIMITLYDYIGKYLPMIPLRDQRNNQTGAFLGSKYGYYCTIDLSDASDLVHYELVKKIFSGTNLKKFLICTRSDHTLLPTREIIKLNKFAPMGSALCFPTESLVFAACCEFACENAKKRWGMSDTSYSVYGDDIIIDNSLFGSMCVILNELGFTINKEKSYHDGPFRESCGKEFHNGQDVTPLKYRLNITDDNNISPEDYASICSFVNGCSERGYPTLRKYLLAKIIKSKPGPLFCDSYGYDPAIFSTHATNFNNFVRWNKNYQRQEVTYLGVVARSDLSLTRTADASMVSLDDALYMERLIEREYFATNTSEVAIDRYSLGAKTMQYKKLKAYL